MCFLGGLTSGGSFGFGSRGDGGMGVAFCWIKLLLYFGFLVGLFERLIEVEELIG